MPESSCLARGVAAMWSSNAPLSCTRARAHAEAHCRGLVKAFPGPAGVEFVFIFACETTSSAALTSLFQIGGSRRFGPSRVPLQVLPAASRPAPSPPR